MKKRKQIVKVNARKVEKQINDIIFSMMMIIFLAINFVWLGSAEVNASMEYHFERVTPTAIGIELDDETMTLDQAIRICNQFVTEETPHLIIYTAMDTNVYRGLFYYDGNYRGATWDTLERLKAWEDVGIKIYVLGKVIDIIGVTDLLDVKTEVFAGTSVLLSAKVVPENATFQTIEWSVVDAGTTKAVIQDGILTTFASGTITIRGCVKSASQTGEDFVKDFVLKVVKTTQKAPQTSQGYQTKQSLSLDAERS